MTDAEKKIIQDVIDLVGAAIDDHDNHDHDEGQDKLESAVSQLTELKERPR